MVQVYEILFLHECLTNNRSRHIEGLGTSTPSKSLRWIKSIIGTRWYRADRTYSEKTMEPGCLTIQKLQIYKSKIPTPLF